jgi:hypothetical protein
MATTEAEVKLAFTEVGTQIKNTRALIGLLSGLTTTEKSSLVAAINEINAKTAGAGAQIDDTTPRSTTVYSSSKFVSELSEALASLKDEILGGAGTTVDTLQEIATLLTNSNIDDDNAIAALTTALGNRVRFDASQTLTAQQKIQANANIGSVSLAQFGDPAATYRDVFLAAL